MCIRDRRAAVALVGPRGARKRATAAAVLEDTPALAFQRTVAAAHLAGRDVDAARRSLVELFDDARRSPLRGNQPVSQVTRELLRETLVNLRAGAQTRSRDGMASMA